MVSIGVTIENPHEANERCSISSILRLWSFLERVFLEIPRVQVEWWVGADEDVMVDIDDDNVLTISGSGPTGDFVRVEDLPWVQYLDIVSRVVVWDEVALGRNVLGGLGDDVLVNDAKLSTVRRISGEVFCAGRSSAAKKAIEVKDGKIQLAVTSRFGVDLADRSTWKTKKKTTISVPAQGEKGFFILQSK